MKAIYALVQDDIEREEGRIDLEQYNKELAEAEDEFTNGDSISNVEMKKQIKQWHASKES
ncbi:hypothetical protein [Flavihumibacter sp. UBA7668]|uniref:hypothetical protein n=1 Tax=Flavihumibacter sp. UBA7668 TaxID=1946542 RepID=UPI0025C2A17A|nr:hypothetical protein [Flavihumibacter sp. UBA7668]